MLPTVINNGAYTAHPFIAADDSYLIWDSERDDGYGGKDLYISFKQADGSWSTSFNLGNTINTAATETGAYVSPDGKYLFFNRTPGKVSNEGDIFWVDAQVVESFRPYPSQPQTSAEGADSNEGGKVLHQGPYK
ncbi:TolB-like translocation protein [Microbulbifer sp. 2201CG32-9]|uniref:hypothetical protein n=1 Tax=Microbulbifer sp. 2201CG32-9 TaxID=3232309 RepID=UPI00345B4F57